MATISDIQEELNQAKELQFVSNALTEVSASKISLIRKEFETNQQFFDEINHIYDLLKQSVPEKTESTRKIVETEVKKPLMAICITPNMRFYGTIPGEVVKQFMDITGPIGADRLVVGQTGIDVLNTTHFPHHYSTMVCAQDIPTREEMTQMLELASAYEKVLVFMPKFQTLLRQTAGVIDITHTKPAGEVLKGQVISTLFEPEVPNIISFFEHQLRTILFSRAMLEAELALTASRLIAMSAAETRADKEVAEKKIRLTMAKRALINRQLLESFAGFLTVKEEE